MCMVYYFYLYVSYSLSEIFYIVLLNNKISSNDYQTYLQNEHENQQKLQKTLLKEQIQQVRSYNQWLLGKK